MSVSETLRATGEPVKPSKAKAYTLTGLNLLSRVMIIGGAAMVLASALNSQTPMANADSINLHIIAGAGFLFVGLVLFGLTTYYKKKHADKSMEPKTEERLWKQVLRSSAYHAVALALIGGIVMILTSQWDALHGADTRLPVDMGIGAATVGGVGLGIAGLLAYWNRKERQEAKKLEAAARL